jgi:hypothetical protein
LMKRELASLRLKYDSDVNVETTISLENRLKEAERRNGELIKEIRGLEKI